MNSVPIDERIAKLASQVQSPEAMKELTSDVFRRAAQMFIEQMLEAEVDELLGRQRYQRRNAGDTAGAEQADAPATGYRNGHKPRQFRTAEGKGPSTCHSSVTPTAGRRRCGGVCDSAPK